MIESIPFSLLLNNTLNFSFFTVVTYYFLHHMHIYILLTVLFIFSLRVSVYGQYTHNSLANLYGHNC